MRVEILPDGRKQFTYRQSWLNTFFDCPDLARRVAFDGLQDPGTDATAMGTALHAGAEHHLRTGAAIAECYEVAVQAFHECTQEPGFRWVQVAKAETALKYVKVCLETWFADVLPRLGSPVAIEHHFKYPIYEDDHMVIMVSGTMDYVDDNGIIWDWKTANDADKYGRKAWEHRRWSVQPTVYTYAWCMETGELAPFIFAATLKGSHRKAAQFVTVVRGRPEWDWLVVQIKGIVDLYEAGLDQWPLRDQHVLCSPKWCPAWSVCKGALVELP